MFENNIIGCIKDLDISIQKQIMRGKDIKKYPSPTQIKIIHYLFEHQNEEIYQKTLENHLKLSRATVSDVLKTMEKNGYILKKPNLEDARTNKIILNNIILDIHKKVMQEVNNINNIIQSNISKDDLNVFIKVVEQMQENLNNTINK